jgi:hypothetical protein
LTEPFPSWLTHLPENRKLLLAESHYRAIRSTRPMMAAVFMDAERRGLVIAHQDSMVEIDYGGLNAWNAGLLMEPENWILPDNISDVPVDDPTQDFVLTANEYLDARPKEPEGKGPWLAAEAKGEIVFSGRNVSVKRVRSDIITAIMQYRELESMTK